MRREKGPIASFISKRGQSMGLENQKPREELQIAKKAYLEWFKEKTGTSRSDHLGLSNLGDYGNLDYRVRRLGDAV